MATMPHPLRNWEARRELRARRRAADAELVASRLPSPRLAWRTQELVAESHRLRLAADVTDIVHAASERLLPGSSPLDRGAVRESRAVLLELASRLYDLDRPVLPRGILLAERLLDGGSRSPLFGSGGTHALQRAVREVLQALDRELADGASG